MRIIGNRGNTARKVQAVASGTLASGDTVIVNADGTVSAVAGSDSSSGSPVVFNAATTVMHQQGSVYDSSNNKVVVVYRDIGNSSYGTAVVGTISGSSISFGSESVFESAAVAHVATTFDSSNNKVVIVYSDSGNSGYGTAVVGTVSGTSISFGTPVVFESSDLEGIGVTFDSSNNKIVVSFSDINNGYYGTVRVGTVSGTSISFGSDDSLNQVTDYTSATFDTVNNKVVIAYTDKSNGNYGTARVGTVSGTNVSFGPEAVYANSSVIWNPIVYDSNSGKVVVCYRDSTDSDKGKAAVGTVSGTSISFGSPVTFASGGANVLSATFDTTSNKVIIAYRDVGNSNYGTIAIGTVSGTSITFESGGVFESAAVDDVTITYDANANKSAVFYYDQGNSNYGTASVFTIGSTNVTSENFIGIASNGYGDTKTATINAKGFIDDNQTGLTAGQSYYVQTDGTLGTTAGDPSVFAGTAVSATKLIVKG